MTVSRVPAGVPTGGQFAASARDEAQVRLDAGTDPLPEPLPVIEHEQVFHVGTLDGSDRKAASYEGDGLSVSIHPDDWAQIAKLPGATHRIQAEDQPLRFVSFHDLDPEARDRLRAWGAEQGWMTERQVYRVSYFDDEWDDVISMEFDDPAEAEAEATALDLDPDDEHTAFVTTSAWRPTPDFPAERVNTDSDPTDLLLAHYVREHRPDIDGIWWEDTYAPEHLSAPRGVLVREPGDYDIVTVTD